MTPRREKAIFRDLVETCFRVPAKSLFFLSDSLDVRPITNIINNLEDF